MTSAVQPGTFQALRGLSRKRAAGERCDLCGLPLGPMHDHLFERGPMRIHCACDPCSILFDHRNGADKLVRIPRDARRLDAFQMDDAAWEALRLPIDLAFFVHNSEAGRVIAYYPSPAGCMESLLNLGAWEQVVADNPPLAEMLPDVEVLLVDRTREHRRYYLAPIDQCYRLTGLIRKEWRGFSGGDEVWRQTDAFFDALGGQTADA